MIQPYAFKGDDFDKVYAQARQFLSMLSVDVRVRVTLPDGFRSVTKFYPDYGTTMTVVEVFAEVEADALDDIESIYAEVATGTTLTTEQDPPMEQTYPYDPFLDEID